MCVSFCPVYTEELIIPNENRFYFSISNWNASYKLRLVWCTENFIQSYCVCRYSLADEALEQFLLLLDKEKVYDTKWKQGVWKTWGFIRQRIWHKIKLPFFIYWFWNLTHAADWKSGCLSFFFTCLSQLCRSKNLKSRRRLLMDVCDWLDLFGNKFVFFTNYFNFDCNVIM